MKLFYTRTHKHRVRGTGRREIPICKFIWCSCIFNISEKYLVMIPDVLHVLRTILVQRIGTLTCIASLVFPFLVLTI